MSRRQISAIGGTATDRCAQTYLPEHVALSGGLDGLFHDPQVGIAPFLRQRRHRSTVEGKTALAALELAAGYGDDYLSRLRWIEVSARKTHADTLADHVASLTGGP